MFNTGIVRYKICDEVLMFTKSFVEAWRDVYIIMGGEV